MRIGSLGFAEILVIAGVIMLLFFGSSLPRLGRRLGKMARKPFWQAQWMWQSFAGSDEESVRAEEEYGRECARQFASEFPREASEARQRQVAEIGSRLAAVAKDAGRRFDFRVVAASTTNAFALPGGFVFVTESLIDLCQRDPDEVAFLVGHEMAHVIHAHSRDKLMVDTIMSAVRSRLSAAAGLLKDLLGAGSSQEQELEADRGAVRLMTAAGFDPRAGVRVLRRLAEVSPDPSGVQQYFSSHPHKSDRIRALEQFLAGAPVHNS